MAHGETAVSSAPPPDGGVRAKLSVMMFLEFFIWGAWYPLSFGYLPSLGFNEYQVALILGTFNLAALLALFLGTQFVDRNFAAERYLAFSHLVGGLAILAVAFVKKPAAGEEDAAFWTVFGLMLVHSLFYVPTISITNSIAFANLRDPQQEFGPVRLWGTIGWIVAGLPFVFLLADWANIPKVDRVPFTEWLGKVLGTSLTGDALRQATSSIFLAAGVASLALAAFSLVLPHTPPRPAAESGERLAWLEAMKLLAIPYVLVLFVVTFLDAAVHQCYFFWAGRYLEHGVGIAGNWVQVVMSGGQVAEILTMAVLGYVLKSLGWRMTMVIGILGHAARFLVFAYFPLPAVAILINLLHGICYAFFFATVYIFVDEFFPKDARASGQGLFNALILGVGPFVGNFVSGRLGALFTLGKDQWDFRTMFLFPAAVAIVAALLLLVGFHPPVRKEAAAPLEPAA
jgi:nucleoside transporter